MKDITRVAPTLITNARLLIPPSGTSSDELIAILFGSHGIEWVGPTGAAPDPGDRGATLVDARKRIITPGFVDAHVHATNTGLMLIGLDLTECRSREDLLTKLNTYAAAHPGSHIIGHGWDESGWPSPTLPTLQEIDRAARGGFVYLSRVDVHSALASSVALAGVPGLEEYPGFERGSAVVSRQAHGLVRTHAFAGIDHSTRRRAQRAFLDHAASRGVTAVHEMAGPTISGEDDAHDLMVSARQEPSPAVFLYWGELASRGGIERALAMGATGVGGDLFLDGAVGSRTAALHEPYSDAPDTLGALYVDEEETIDHLVACTRAGMQAGFHVIGDRACDVVIGALQRAAVRVGPEFRDMRHRLEHAEMLSDHARAQLADLGVIVSMQPLFDELWSNPGGMYEQRLGSARAWSMNRWGSAIRAGATVTFSSDCPVTELSPWAAIRAAMSHHDPDERFDLGTAVDAHTRAGWASVRVDHAGNLVVGHRADIALWDSDPDWHSDWQLASNSVTSMRETPVPTCAASWVAGDCVYGSGDAA